MDAHAVPPSLELAAAFAAMLDDFAVHDPENAEYYLPARVDFAGYVRRLLDEELGRNLAPGYVPCSHRWLLAADGRIVGTARLRHRADTPFLAAAGGHVGYDIAPSARGHGYGHLAMATALAAAREIGLAEVLAFAAETNLASRAVITRAGGQLEAITWYEPDRERLCRYRIAVPAAP